jgi:hypothetical protein
MDTLMATRRTHRRPPSLSSRRVEEAGPPSGLPPQGSIVGCLGATDLLAEVSASLERLGQERSHVKELFSRIPLLIVASGCVVSGDMGPGAVLGSLGGEAFTIASGTVGPNDVGSGTAQSGDLFEGLMGASSPATWLTTLGQARTCTAYSFPTGLCRISSIAPTWGLTYLVRLEPAGPAGGGSGQLHSGGSGAWEPVAPDTDRTYTVQQMAEAWKNIGQPITEDDVSLSVDPDDYPLF